MNDKGLESLRRAIFEQYGTRDIHLQSGGTGQMVSLPLGIAHHLRTEGSTTVMELPNQGRVSMPVHALMRHLATLEI